MGDSVQTLTLAGLPQPRQAEFFGAREKYIAYGGARGGGKSWALRRKLVLMCLKYPGLRALLVRRTYFELRENHIRVLLSELSGVASYIDSRKCFEFVTGSVLKLGYCDAEEDVLQYQGIEYDVIAIDEATQLTEYQFQTLKACLRGANGFPKRMYLTCNPGGVGHAWVKRLFIDREYRKGEKPEDFKFIPAKVYDNEILLRSNPDYLDQLESLPTELRNSWLCGEWGAFSGQYFPEFDSDVHVKALPVSGGTAIRYCAIDYGLDMLAAMFVAVYASGEAYVYDEVYRSGLIVSDAARAILEKSEGVSVFIAPSDLWSRQKDSGKSIAELFGENGVWLTEVRSERVDGWMCLKEWLKVEVAEDGKRSARLTLNGCCRNIIRCLPLLMHDRDNPADAATRPHEITHAPDALRYFAVYRSSVPHADSKGGIGTPRLIDSLSKRARVIR